MFFYSGAFVAEEMEMAILKKIAVLLIGIFLLIISNNAHALTAIWDPNPESDDVCKYKVHLCSSYDKASRLEADVVDPQFVENPCICCDKDKDCQVDWDVYWDDHDCVFIAVTAIDTLENESEPTIAYILYGNICGTYNDGTSHIEAAVDGDDLAAFATCFGTTGVTHQQINCDEVFPLIIPTLKQRSDMDRDGDVDVFDLIEFIGRFGNTIE